MICDNCGQQIQDKSNYCNVCGHKLNDLNQPKISMVNSIHTDQYRIIIETNDPVVIENCKKIYEKLNYEFAITDSCKRIHKNPELLYFITEGMDDYSLFKAIRVDFDKALNDRKNFGVQLGSILILSGYQKQPGVTIYTRNNK